MRLKMKKTLLLLLVILGICMQISSMEQQPEEANNWDRLPVEAKMHVLFFCAPGNNKVIEIVKALSKIEPVSTEFQALARDLRLIKSLSNQCPEHLSLDLFESIKSKHPVRVIEALLNLINDDFIKNTALIYAAEQCCDDKMIDLFLEDNANQHKEFYHRDSLMLAVKNGSTSLMSAATNGQEAIVLFLLANNTTAQDRNDSVGNTALIRAVDKGHTQIVSHLLLQNSVGINNHTVFGFTPLIYAVDRGHIEITKLLLEYNANPNIGDGRGEIPLLLAVKKNNVEMAKLLIAHNADVTIRNANGFTPLRWATIKKNEEMLALLNAHQ